MARTGDGMLMHIGCGVVRAGGWVPGRNGSQLDHLSPAARDSMEQLEVDAAAFGAFCNVVLHKEWLGVLAGLRSVRWSCLRTCTAWDTFSFVKALGRSETPVVPNQIFVVCSYARAL